MYPVKQKVSDAAAVAKEHMDILKAKSEEKAEKAVARTKEEKEIAYEHRKAKEAEAKMNMHLAKAEHAAEKLQHGLHRYPVAPVAPTMTGAAPNYPPAGGWTGPI